MFKKKKIGNKKDNQNKIDVTNLIKIQKWFVQSKQSKSSFVKYFLIVSLIIISMFWIWILKQVSSIKFDLDSIIGFAWFDLKFEEVENVPTIKKSTDGKTNIVIIWRWWQENDAPELTDSILVASINYDKKSVSMFSVPRDLYVEFPTGWAWKINEAYFRGLRKYKDEFQWMGNLQEILTKITGEEIHYFVNLDFEWFRKIIDTLGGIDIDVPNEIIDTTYPGPNSTYQTFKISAGPQNLDGATALKYARSRHTTSDFDRSLRQQLIIKAIREKALSLELITSPSKIKSIYNIVNQHIVTDLDLSQMIQLALFVKDIPRENIVSSNLNDTCFYGSSVCEKWWFLYVPLRADFWGASVLLQEWGTKWNPSNYSKLIQYTNIIFNYPWVYSENLKVNVFNATWVWGLANELASSLKKYWFNIPEKNSVWNTSWEKYEKSKILYSVWTWWTKPETVSALELFIFWWSENIESLPKYSQDPEVKIEIIIWDDYKFLNF